MNAVEMVKEICKERNIPISRLKELYLNELITLDDYKHDLAAYKADIDTFKAEAMKYRSTDKKALYDLI